MDGVTGTADTTSGRTFSRSVVGACVASTALQAGAVVHEALVGPHAGKLAAHTSVGQQEPVDAQEGATKSPATSANAMAPTRTTPWV